MTNATVRRGWRADLGRSMRLFRAFGVEQTDPDRFYETLAEDSVGQLSEYVALDGALMLDVGGGPGYFGDAFRRAGATDFDVGAVLGERRGRGGTAPRVGRGSGMALPVGNGTVDVFFSSRVLDQVPGPWLVAGEMVRRTRPGGTVFLS